MHKCISDHHHILKIVSASNACSNATKSLFFQLSCLLRLFCICSLARIFSKVNHLGVGFVCTLFSSTHHGLTAVL